MWTSLTALKQRLARERHFARFYNIAELAHAHAQTLPERSDARALWFCLASASIAIAVHERS